MESRIVKWLRTGDWCTGDWCTGDWCTGDWCTGDLEFVFES